MKKNIYFLYTFCIKIIFFINIAQFMCILEYSSNDVWQVIRINVLLIICNIKGTFNYPDSKILN